MKVDVSIQSANRVVAPVYEHERISDNGKKWGRELLIRLIMRTNSTLIQSDPRLCRYTVVVAPLAFHG